MVALRRILGQLEQVKDPAELATICKACLQVHGNYLIGRANGLDGALAGEVAGEIATLAEQQDQAYEPEALTRSAQEIAEKYFSKV